MDLRGPLIEHASVAKASNQVAFKLFQRLIEKDQNLVFSPLSVSIALAMLHCGCRLETAKEMRWPLGYEAAKLKNEDIASNFLNILKSFEEESKGYILACANSLLCDKKFSVKREYSILINESFKGICDEVDFKNDSDAAVVKINEWVNEKTNGMIPELLSCLNPDSVMILLNAIYFKGSWLKPFQDDWTRPRYFYNNGLERNAKQVEMMVQSSWFPFMQHKHFKSVQLPYKCEDMCMQILLPHTMDGIGNIEDLLSPSFILGLLLRKMDVSLVHVDIPKFRMEYSRSLVDKLKPMWIEKIFQEGVADFGGINDSKDLYISDIFHKAVIEVNERGSEASGAPHVTQESGYPPSEDFIVDHPFMFLIFSRLNNLIYFMGKVEKLA